MPLETLLIVKSALDRRDTLIRLQTKRSNVSALSLTNGVKQQIDVLYFVSLDRPGQLLHSQSTPSGICRSYAHPSYNHTCMRATFSKEAALAKRAVLNKSVP